jgi:hypothetical protein
VDLWRTIPSYLKVFIVANSTFSLLALLGALFALRSQSPAASPLAAVLMVYPIVFYITHTGLRYRFPIDPLMVVFAVYAVVHCLSRVRGRRVALVPETMTRNPGQSFS